jgi:hypothetical protein
VIPSPACVWRRKPQFGRKNVTLLSALHLISKRLTVQSQVCSGQSTYQCVLLRCLITGDSLASVTIVTWSLTKHFHRRRLFQLYVTYWTFMQTDNLDSVTEVMQVAVWLGTTNWNCYACRGREVSRNSAVATKGNHEKTLNWSVSGGYWNEVLWKQGTDTNNVYGSNSTEQVPSLEADSRLVDQELPCFYGIRKVLCSQETTTGPCPEPVESSPHPHTLFLDPY